MGEYVVFLAHFERGFGLPVSDFMRDFMDRFRLQPHHLPANAFVSLSSFVTFTEGYLDLLPSIELWAKYFVFKKQVLPNKADPEAEKELTQCGAPMIAPRRNSILRRIKGLDSCRMWQKSFFYVRNVGVENLINMPPYVYGSPTQHNWGLAPNKTDT